MEMRGGPQPCQPGLHFASRWVGGLMPGQVVDYLPEEQLLEVRNLGEFAGILALDKWTCNINGRQAVFQKSRRERRYQRYIYRPGILLSCRGLEVRRCQPGRRFCREHRLPGGDRLGELRALAEPYREPGPGDRVGDRGDHPAGMVRRRPERPGGAAGEIAGAPRAGARVDRGVQGIGAAAISELGWGVARQTRRQAFRDRNGCRMMLNSRNLRLAVNICKLGSRGRRVGENGGAETMRVSTHPLCAGPGEERVRQYRRAAARLRQGTRACCALPGTGPGSAASIPTRTRRCSKPWRSKSDSGCRPSPPIIPEPIMALLEDSLSNGLQITESQGVPGGDLSHRTGRPDAPVCR